MSTQLIAPRITHLPSKIVVQCQNERSQHKNKETCFKMFKARLYEHEIQKRERKSNQKELNTKTDIGLGPSNKVICLATLSISQRSKK